MNDETAIVGTAINGTAGTAVFDFYSGPVGIRQRGGVREVAFFSAPVFQPELPCKATVNGKPVTVTEIEVRPLNPGERARGRSLCAIVATVSPLPAT